MNLQVLAVMQGDDGSWTSSRHPGLSKVAERWLGRTVNKAEQCSDWDARPLSPAQLAYAAMDSAVLVEIHESMARASEVSTSS